MAARGQEASIVHHGINEQLLHLTLEEVWVSAVIVDGKQVDRVVTPFVSVTDTPAFFLWYIVACLSSSLGQNYHLSQILQPISGLHWPSEICLSRSCASSRMRFLNENFGWT